MTWVVPLALGGFAILLMAVFTMLSARKRHRAIVAPAIPAGPRILVHDINDDRCTGCDACVAVCPTNVLDLVANKSRVIAFHECIQCEQCMFACPTEALVMYPKGGTPPVLKVPEIDENFQTAVVGQYLIGEVAGKPLVKNAANLGRAVVEHMLQTGLQPGALGGGPTNVDVAIVGSGPGGLSAALTCIQKGLSYVVLEKEQMIASTISRYPKGKLVMAEPYDTQNMSLLPVFDAGKEQLIPIWSEVIERVGMTIKQGESVETVARGADGVFDVRTTVATYRAQRMVLSIGTRGKPRTLQVPGENLPKIYSLLEDPDEWRGKSVLICGGGDSACEAALALADAGAKVMISYRGKGFNRAAPKNKSAIEGYASQGRIKAKLGSQIINFDAETVTLGLNDGSQKRYPNDAAFVLIGADPPISWLEKVGVRFVERPHQYQLGKTDDIVRKFIPRAVECPEDAARAAAQVLGGSIGVEPTAAPPARSIESATAAAAAEMGMMPLGEPVSGPRKWLRSATSIFSTRPGTNQSGQTGMMPMQGQPVRADARAQRAKKLDAPMPLSEFAKRSKASMHSGHGRRDSLTAGERTRILRMLRDEGGRLADEESQVFIGGGPPDYDFDFDDSPPPANMVRPDVPAKPAVVVGIAQAQAARNGKRDKASAQIAAAQARASAPMNLPQEGGELGLAGSPRGTSQQPRPPKSAQQPMPMFQPSPEPQPAYAEQVYPQQAYPQQAYPQPGYPQQAQPGYPQQGYPQQGYPHQEAQPGYPQPSYPPPQEAQQSYPPEAASTTAWPSAAQATYPPEAASTTAWPSAAQATYPPEAASTTAWPSTAQATYPPQAPYHLDAQAPYAQPPYGQPAYGQPDAPAPYQLPLPPEPYVQPAQPPQYPQAYGEAPYQLPPEPPYQLPLEPPYQLPPEPPYQLAPEPPYQLPPEPPYQLPPEPEHAVAPHVRPRKSTSQPAVAMPRPPKPTPQQMIAESPPRKPTSQHTIPSGKPPSQPPMSAQQARPDKSPSQPSLEHERGKPASRPNMGARATAQEPAASPPRSRVMPAAQPSGRRAAPVPFGDEPTRQVDDELLAQLRNAPPAKPSPKPGQPAKPGSGTIRAMHNEPTRMNLEGPSRTVEVSFGEDGDADLTRPREDFPSLMTPAPPGPPPPPPRSPPNIPAFDRSPVEDHRDSDDATKLSSLEGMAALERSRQANDERSRAVNIRNDPSIADIDWDLD